MEDGSTVVGTYDYDAKLQRVKADTAQGHVEYVLDGKYVLREAGARSRRYHFGEGEALAVTGVGGTAGQDRWLLTDALGSVVTEADATATSVTARQFDAWGNYRNNTAPTANETRLGYTGHQFDVETGLTYARARYYDSKLGVFLSRDSFEGLPADAPSLHRFSYSHNSPLKYRDPSGRCINFATGDWVSWSMCRESGKALAGYAVGMGSVALHAAVGVVDVPTGGAVSRGIDAAAHLASSLSEGRFFETAAQVTAEQRGMLKELREGPLDSAKQELAEIHRLAESGDSFGLGRKGGVAVTTTALTVEGARALRGESSGPRGIRATGERTAVEQSSGEPVLSTNRLPASGNPILDTPMFTRAESGEWIPSARFQSWSKRVAEVFKFEVKSTALEEGNPANVVPGTRTVEVDPAQARYVDILHESRHLWQVKTLETRGMPVSMGKSSRAIYEIDAYKYEQRVANAYGDSAQPYQEFLSSRVCDYWRDGISAIKRSRSQRTLQSIFANPIGD